MKKFKGINGISKEQTALELGSLIWGLKTEQRVAAWSFFEHLVVPEDVKEYNEEDFQGYILDYLNNN